MRRLTIACAGAALGLLAARAVYICWQGDDFLTAAALEAHGFWGAQKYWWTAWSGRYAFTFFMTLLHAIGPWFAPAVVPLLVAGLTAALWRALRDAALALALSYAIVAGCPNVPQSVLWQTGAVTYITPLAGMAWLLGRRDERAWPAAYAAALLAFSEVSVICQAIAFAGGWAAVPRRRRFFAASLLASLLALAIIAAAPGNINRRAVCPPTPSPRELAVTTAQETLRFFTGVVTASGFPLLLAFAAGALFAPRVAPRLAVVAALVALAAVVATNFSTIVLLSQPPPGRALIVPWAFVVAAAAAAGAAIRVPPRRAFAALLVAAVAGGPLLSAAILARELPHARRVARGCNAVDHALRRLRGRDAVVNDADAALAMGIMRDPTWDWNRNAAAYYGLRSVRAAGFGAMPALRGP